MGSGKWDTTSYAARASFKSSNNITNMAYSGDVKSGKVAAKVHDDLEPTKANGAGMHAGMNVRESLDSPEHLTSVAVAVLFDVTGSMGTVPGLLVDKLPDLWGLILKKGYVEDPQLLFGAIGDAYSDMYPLQIAQFESDNRSDEDLEKIILEGNGGGGGCETYELAMYFMARKTYIDCYEKRQKRGYLFLIGDESPYQVVSKNQIVSVIGDTPEADIPTSDIVAELQQKYDVYLIRPHGGSYPVGSTRGDEVMRNWKALLPAQNIINLDENSAVAEVIALTLGLAEGVVGSLDEALDDLRDYGASDAVTAVVGKALATVGAAGAVAVSDAPDGLSGDDSVERL